jgi:cytochrome P450
MGMGNYTGNTMELIKGVSGGDLVALAGGPLFLLLEQYYQEYGPIYKLAFGPKSFMVVSDPVIVKYLLKENPGNYDKGLLAEILEPIMGNGLIPAEPKIWKKRRKAIVPGFHKAWLKATMNLFVGCNMPLQDKLMAAAEADATLNMETEFCSLSLDIIGRAVFNYDFGSVTKESPVVKAVYSALQEAERRSTSFIPYWNIPFANKWLSTLKEFEKDMVLLNGVLDELIAKALATQNQVGEDELKNRNYDEMENPSLLRFLVDMRGEEASSKQLRDDLMTMLIAGHETTAAVLTWSMFELSQQPKLLAEVRAEIDQVLGDRAPTYDDMMKLKLVRLCLAETLRMYPAPPLLIRRAINADTLPAGGAGRKTYIPRGTDVFISTWNMHRSPEFWDEPGVYNPKRFLKEFHNSAQESWAGYVPGGEKQLYPNEVHSDFAFLPFGGGTRKCVGDQFAMMESIATLCLVLQRFDFSLDCERGDVQMRTGATIHTSNGLPMKVSFRKSRP